MSDTNCWQRISHTAAAATFIVAFQFNPMTSSNAEAAWNINDTWKSITDGSGVEARRRPQPRQPVRPAPRPTRPTQPTHPSRPGGGIGGGNGGGNSGGHGAKRNVCFSYAGGGSTGRSMGDRNARRLFQNIWDRLGRRCDMLDDLATIISETPLQKPYGKGPLAGCFYVGYVDALWEELEGAYTRCGDVCFDAGAEIGNISAQGYCYASIALDGLYDPGFISQPPLPFCGTNLAIGCKTEYVATAKQDIPACYEYTVGYFEETFENTVRQDCFVPRDVPIIDW